MKKVSRATALIEKLVENRTLTPEGRDWLVLSLDPFHDLDHTAAGYPDADSTHTVVSCFQSAVDVSKPANITTATWDAHVYTMPFSNADGGNVGMLPADIPASASQATRNIAGVNRPYNFVNVLTNDSGQSLYPVTDAEEIAATLTQSAYNPAGTALNGTASRIIGMAIEIVDTTADVYKQGAVTCYRLPQMPSANTRVYTDLIAAYTGVRDCCTTYRAPPSTVAQALKLVGSRQWDARQGCYSLVTQSTVDNPMHVSSVSRVDVVPGNGRSCVGMFDYCAPPVANVPPAASILTSEMKNRMPLNTTGIMLTGLNALSTFRLKIKMYVETAPQPWQPDLVVLASPSAPFDPVALEAYSKTLSTMPVGVPASENGLGDWFAGIADVLSKVALPVSMALTPFAGPAAPMIGAGIAGLAGGVRQMFAGQKSNDALYPKATPQSLRAAPQQRQNQPKQQENKKKRVVAGLARLRARKN